MGLLRMLLEAQDFSDGSLEAQAGASGRFWNGGEEQVTVFS